MDCFRKTKALRLVGLCLFTLLLSSTYSFPILTIESLDGDIIDCIDIHKQPAFDHPLLKNHKIQKMPSRRPKVRNVIESGAAKHTKTVWQTWHLNGTDCPRDTIPVRRTRADESLKTKSFKTVLRPQSGPLKTGTHEYAVVRKKQQVYGAKATFNVWSPSVQLDGEFSLAQIWLDAGKVPNENTVEAGWQVAPDVYPDRKPRLFTYWTNDSYTTGGCVDLRCPGFVQVDKNTVVGGSLLEPISTYGGEQFEVTLFIWQDLPTKNWWLSTLDGPNSVDIGYWPAELVPGLKEYATQATWGGEVVNLMADGKHTFTQMGSGHFADEGFGKASYVANLQIVDSNGKLFSAGGDVEVAVPTPTCYDLKLNIVSADETSFFFGGPGNNPNCP